jgi:nucleoside-diphosphate-sugar epimerase
MILVTGGTGFIGSHLLDRLSSAGAPVRCLIRKKSGRPKLPSGVEPVPGDLESGAGVAAALAGVDLVIHLAGVTKALTPAQYYAGNARATETLVRAMAGGAARLLHVSSLAAAGPSPDGVPLNEDAPPRPVSHYGKSKLEAEQIVRGLAPDAIIVRPPVVYGPRDTDVFQLLKSISRGLVLEIAGGERWFSAIYVEDLVDGLIVASQDTRALGRTYYLANREPVSWTRFGEVAAAVMHRTPRILRVPLGLARAAGGAAEAWSRVRGRPGIISREKIAEAQCAHWTCDPARAAAELGFEAATSLQAGLERTLAWYKEAGWLNY